MVDEKQIQWTPRQRAGITTTGENLLVSAAAGSGKTTVLAERCAHLVCGAANPCDVDQLLVVTFTEATAAQMKSRIGQSLRLRAEADPENARLHAQVAQIDRARISTLHGFCSRLLRDHFHLVGLDPGFTVLEENEAKLLRTQIVKDVVVDRYERDEFGLFQELLDIYTDGNDAAIQQHLLAMDALLSSMSDPEEWMLQARDRLKEAASKPLDQSELGRALIDHLRLRIEAVRLRCEAVMRMIRAIDGLPKIQSYVMVFLEEIGRWAEALGRGGVDCLAKIVANFAPSKQPPIPESHPNKKTILAAIHSIRGEMGDKGGLYKLLRFKATQWQAGVASMVGYAEIFLDCAAEFRKRYQEAKRRMRQIDFADMERLVLGILRQKKVDGSWEPSQLSKSLHRQIAQVLVDEYQDINALQDEILRLVSHESASGRDPNLFCVGDVKQSIYGFRLAEPERFLDRYRRYRNDPPAGRVIDLQENFRSRAPLLEAINGLFERLMTREAADIDYDQSQRLIPGASFPASNGQNAFSGAPIEIHVLPCGGVESEEESESGELDRTELEGTLIARRIREMVGIMQVADQSPDGAAILRPMRYRDIVVLLRSAVYKDEQIAGMLRRAGLPVHLESGTGFFDSPEIRDLLALLKMLDNSRQDIPLVTVLRSPLSALLHVEDLLARVRLAYPRPMAFHEAFARYAVEQTDSTAEWIARFVARLERWRTLARRRPLSDLIAIILDETGYLAFCSGLEDGEQRVANLMEFQHRARRYGDASGRGLFAFLRALDRLRDEADLGTPSARGDAEDVVRIMTVHKSKGLEFPVVFLPDLGKRFNLKSTQSRILIDRNFGIGMPAFDRDRQARYPSLPSVLVKQKLRQKAMAEELRVLYVAMTRAKEHLILIGTADEKSILGWESRWLNHDGALPADVVLDAGTPLDWIGPVEAALRSKSPSMYQLSVHPSEEVAAWSVEATKKEQLNLWQLARAGLQPLDPPPLENMAATELIDRLAFRYPHEPATIRRAAMAATEWAKGNAAAPAKPSFFEPQLSLPICAGGNCDLNAADVGNATHLVLEHLDFMGDCSQQGVLRQIDRLRERRLINEMQAKAVDVEAIEWFIATELGQRIRAAGKANLRREIPFTLCIGENPADEGLDRQMIRGRIDLLIRDGEQCAVVDYKTDRVDLPQIDQRAQGYASQVRLYRDAIQQLTPLRVSAVYLVFLFPRHVHEVNLISDKS